MQNDEPMPTQPFDEPALIPAQSDILPDAPAATATATPPQRKISTTTRVLGGCLGCLGVFIALTLVLGGITAAFGFSILRQDPLIEQSSQSFAVTAPPQITVRSSAGNVRVEAGADGTVTVQITKSARGLSKDQERRDLNAMHVAVTQFGNTVTIDEQNDKNASWLSLGSRTLDLVITVPAQATLDEKLSAGNLEVSGITGQMTIEASAGNIGLHNVTLTGASRLSERAGNITFTGKLLPDANLTMENSAGNITFDGDLATNNTLNAHNSAGNIDLTLPETTSAHISAGTSAGNVHINGWDIPVSRETANASARGDTSTNPTNTITANNSAGNIDISAR